MYIIVEDDPSVADALESLLSGAGLPVRVFASAEEFIHSASLTAEDTMIVDLGLPA
jgi:Response regulator